MKRVDYNIRHHVPRGTAMLGTPAEWSALANGMRVAADKYEKDAAEISRYQGNYAMVKQLYAQADEARALADKINAGAGV